jgi:hypothetical protein
VLRVRRIHSTEDGFEQLVRLVEDAVVERRGEAFQGLDAAEPLVHRRGVVEFGRERVPEAGVPVRAVAERLVPGVPASAQGLPFPYLVGCAVGAHHLHRSAHPVRSVHDRRDRRRIVLLFGGRQRARRAAAHDLDDFLRRGFGGGHERLLGGPEHSGKPIGALAEMGAPTAVVVDRHAFAPVDLAALRDAVVACGLRA